MTPDFRSKYGPWALVAGASEGLGAAFARALVSRGVHVLLVARRAALLEELAGELRARGGEAKVLCVDLTASDLAQRVASAARDLEIGLLVCNAAYAPVGDFVTRPLEDHLRALDVNTRAPIVLAHTLLAPMLARGRGGVVLMSSLAGSRGTPRLASYAGTKAFNDVFGESLWFELREAGVDVAVCSAGAIRTPGYTASALGEAPGTLDADHVAEAALDALGRGPRVVPGWVNRVASGVLARLLPRRLGVGAMARNTRDLS